MWAGWWAQMAPIRRTRPPQCPLLRWAGSPSRSLRRRRRGTDTAACAVRSFARWLVRHCRAWRAIESPATALRPADRTDPVARSGSRSGRRHLLFFLAGSRFALHIGRQVLVGLGLRGLLEGVGRVAEGDAGAGVGARN